MAKVFEKCDVRYSLCGEGYELRRARERTGGTMTRAAFLCGWSTQYQWKLENGEVNSVCEETKRLIERALAVMAGEGCV